MRLRLLGTFTVGIVALACAVPDTATPPGYGSGGQSGFGGGQTSTGGLAAGGGGSACSSAGMKLCNGACVLSGPATGCGQPGCNPCPAPSSNGSAACSGGACSITCQQGYIVSGSECIPDPALLPPECSDGVKGDSETDVDCGGICGATCATGQACAIDGDCRYGTCDGGVCACTPACAAGACGIGLADGCGGVLDCTCPGDVDVCNNGTCCTPTTCGDVPTQCGDVSDGCGATINCDSNCDSGEVCNAGTCCKTTTCGDVPTQCGDVSDGCGATINCDSNCTSGQVCNAGTCCDPVATCTLDCGAIDDTCGGTVSCGTCATAVPCDANACAAVTGFGYTPSNFDPRLEATPAATTLDCGVSTFDSASLTFTGWCGTAPVPVVQTQSSGPDVVVLPLSDLTIASGSTLRIVGDRPVILAVWGNATISGTIDAGARGATPGAGGDVSCSAGIGGDGGGDSADAGGGGGGGGFGTTGATGGSGHSGSGNADGGSLGDIEGSSVLVPLRGGCRGGEGGTGSSNNPGGGGAAGGGGGAIQLSVAGTLDVAATAVIAAGGGGGVDSSDREGGGGGGSGGAVLLEGDAVTIASGAWLTANGGGGAGGDGGGNGADGSLASSVAASGGPGASGGGNGGQGASALTNATDGTQGGSNDGGGGGGGGVGRIRVNSPNACTVSASSSPAVSLGC